MESSAFSFISPSCNGDNQDKIETYHSEKKLKLFGIEFHTSQDMDKENKGNNNDNEAYDESVNSSSSSTISSSSGGGIEEKISKESSSTTETAAPPPKETNKFVCQYCKKRFPNSQALGGHQNAHKRERMTKKKLQLEARKASINYYLQPYKNNPSFDFSSPWLYDHTNTQVPEFKMYDQTQVSFSQKDQDKCYYIPFEQEDSNMFTLTHIDNRQRDTKPQVLVKPFHFVPSMKNSKSLDLQLGLNLPEV